MDAPSREPFDIRSPSCVEIEGGLGPMLDLRAVTLVANAAAHEINNPLTVIVGSMELLQRRLAAGGPELRWIERAVDASQRIREIVARMTHITKVEASGSFPGVPAMLDIQRSSEDN